MSHPTRLGCATALAALLVPQIATAQVTADDVWQNMQDYFGTFSSDITATTARDGDTLSVSDMTMKFTLPLDAGTIALTLAGTELTEQDDGTVSITYPEPVTFGFVADITDEGKYSGRLDLTLEQPVYTASGIPGDITYVYSYDRITIELGSLTVDGVVVSVDSNASLISEISGFSGTSQITVADLVTATSRFSMGNQQYAGGFGDGEGGVATFSGSADTMTASTTMALPRGGMDIMNLAAALRDGLALTMTTGTTGYETGQSSEKDGKVMTSSTSRAGVLEGHLEFGRNGIRRTGSAEEFEFTMQPAPDFPVPVEFMADKVSGGMTIPLSAARDLQDVAITMSLEGVTMAEQLWSMFDPGQSLPRDPATVSLDMSAKVKNLVDWLDFLSVRAFVESGTRPVELHALTLNGLSVDMAGARLTGSGAATFDNSDLVSFGGFPKPVGALDLALSGGNGLIDRLVEMGLMTEDNAMGTRMMMAGFASPDPDAGEDALKSRLEINEKGQILANGQRLR